jgi:hypothetical protein
LTIARLAFGDKSQTRALLVEAADRIKALEAENDRLSKAVGSGILGQLLNDEETDEFVKFIKFLRSGRPA